MDYKAADILYQHRQVYDAPETYFPLKSSVLRYCQ